jgi:hypothetical protein
MDFIYHYIFTINKICWCTHASIPNVLLSIVFIFENYDAESYESRNELYSIVGFLTPGSGKPHFFSVNHD